MLSLRPIGLENGSDRKNLVAPDNVTQVIDPVSVTHTAHHTCPILYSIMPQTFTGRVNASLIACVQFRVSGVAVANGISDKDWWLAHYSQKTLYARRQQGLSRVTILTKWRWTKANLKAEIARSGRARAIPINISHKLLIVIFCNYFFLIFKINFYNFSIIYIISQIFFNHICWLLSFIIYCKSFTLDKKIFSKLF